MNQSCLSLALGAALLLAACGDEARTPAPAPATPPAPTVVATPPLGDLHELGGKTPELLLSEPKTADRLRALVPPELMACAKDVFNYMPDLELRPDGSLHAELNGSHAEAWRIGMLHIQPAGEINLFMDCSAVNNGSSGYYLLSSRQPGDKPAEVLRLWLGELSLPSTASLLISNGQSKRERPLGDFLGASAQAVAAKPLAEQSPQAKPAAALPAAPVAPSSPSPVAETSVPLGGAWQCQADRSQGMSRITFGERGRLEWVDDPGTRLESRRLGNYRLNNGRVSIEITELPKLASLGRSPHVSIGEKAEIKRLETINLQFSWWQDAEPGDRVNFKCTRELGTVAPAALISRPAAEAIVRNQALLADAHERKCRMLENAFGASPVGEYQLKKAGC